MRFVCLVIVSVCLGLACFAEAKHVQRNCGHKKPTIILTKDLNISPTLSNTKMDFWDALVYLYNVYEYVNQFLKSKIEVDKKSIIFYYMSRKTDSMKFYIDDIQNIGNLTDFDPNRRTMFLMHGWTDDKDSDINTLVSKALLTTEDWNVFVVDWSVIAKSTQGYQRIVNAIPEVGAFIANFIKKVQKYAGLKMKRLHLCGHSLGAHVAGRVGAELQGQAGSLVGLDPALPAFDYNNISQRIDPSDAQYVQIIHTNGRRSAFLEPLGHSDFYPNGGETQNGCYLTPRRKNDPEQVTFELSTFFRGCSHARAVKYFAESIYNGAKKFRAKKCKSYDDFQNGSCEQNKDGIMGGNRLDEKLSGTYYLDTARSKPFALG